MAPTLADLPPALLERHLCVFLDAASLARLELATGACGGAALWATHVSRRFGLAAAARDNPRSGRLQRAAPSPVRWRRVFAAAQQDARALAAAAGDCDAARVCADRRAALALALSAPELAVRDELALMQALVRFPASAALIALYARWLRSLPASSGSPVAAR